VNIIAVKDEAHCAKNTGCAQSVFKFVYLGFDNRPLVDSNIFLTGAIQALFKKLDVTNYAQKNNLLQICRLLRMMKPS
jgi:hypothetical protein